MGAPVGRRRGGARAGVAPRGRCRDPSTGLLAAPLLEAGSARCATPSVRRGQPHQRPDPRLHRADQAAAPGEAAAAGLPDEDVAEEDLLDTAWLQRLRRISQLQSARWVFPTAEHSRFTHGLGVMHEAGLWARSLYPSLRAALPAGPRRADPIRRPGHRDAADGRPAARRRPRPVRPLLRRPRPRRLPGPGRRPPPAEAAVPRGPERSGSSRTSSAAPAWPAPGTGRRRRARRLRRRRVDRPRWVSFLIAKPALADPAMPRWVRWLAAAPVGRVHGRQPRLRPARRVPHRRRGRAGRRRAPAALHVHLRARPDPVRAGPAARSRCS